MTVEEYDTNVLPVIAEWRQIMKLNKYIRQKLSETWPVSGRREEEELFYGNPLPTEEDIEEWIGEWYKDIYGRDPPTWLCGKRWYDRRQQKIDEAKIND